MTFGVIGRMRFISTALAIGLNAFNLTVLYWIGIYFFVSFMGGGAFLAVFLCLLLSFLSSFGPFRTNIHRVAFIICGSVVIFGLVALWAITFPPRGTQIVHAASTTTTLLEDGTYTDVGIIRVWTVTAIAMGGFLVSELLRAGRKMLATRYL